MFFNDMHCCVFPFFFFTGSNFGVSMISLCSLKRSHTVWFEAVHSVHVSAQVFQHRGRVGVED